MLTILQDIAGAILDLPFLLIGLLIESLNGWIMLLDLMLAAAVAVLPGFPDLPDMPTQGLGLVAWFFPVTAMLGVLGTYVAAFITWLGVSVALKWAKAQ